MSSSPFDLFRRNLKPMMVFLTLLALLSFVVLPSIAMYQQNRTTYGSAPTTMATFDGGQYDRTKVSYFTRNHFATTQFLRDLAEETISHGRVPKVADFQYNTQQKTIQSLGINSNPSDQSSVRILMFAGEAKKAGLDLDDTAIQNWLTLYSDGRLSNSQINGILASSTNNKMGQVQLYEQLRMQLLATAYQRQVMGGLTAGGQPILPPAEQWELFLRLNRRAVADAYAVNVADFIEETDAKPAEKEILAVYEAGKAVYPDDQSAKPAFRRPYTANIEYLSGNLNDFIDRERTTITEEQLRAEYQKRLDGGDFKLPEAVPTEAKPADAATAVEVPDVEAPSTEAPATEVMQDPKVEAPVTEAPATEQPETQPAEDPAAPAATEAKPSEAESSNLEYSSNAVRLVTMQVESDTANPADGEDVKVPTETVKPNDAPLEPTDAPTVDTNKPAETKPDAPKVESFEKVRDDIARSLAMQPALNKLDAAVTEVDKVMRTYFNAKAIAGGKSGKSIAPPDMKALADKLGMKHVVTGMMDGRDIQKDPVNLSFGVGTGMQRGDGFVQTMYVARPQLFTPVRTVDDQARISYISWKSEEQAAFIPDLKDVREEVITAIRMAEGRKLAQVAAEKLAKEFADSDKPKELVPADRSSMYFESLGPFSWMNSFGFGMRAFMGNVPELDRVGEPFMRQVFMSDRGKWGVAPNMPETVYYVVRPTEFSPSTDELHQRFTQLSQRMQTMSLAVEEAIKIRDSHYEALDRRTGFKWNEEALDDK